MNAPHQIRVRSEGRTAWITLARPPLNIMGIAMMREMQTALEGLGGEIDFLVFEGEGEKGFSAGAEVGDHTRERVGDMLAAFHRVFLTLWQGRFITIAGVRGVCLGGGCELATFCDFLVADEAAKFGQPEIKLGCFPPVALVLYPRLIGMRAAMDLILTGRTISARDAQQLGFVSRMASAGGLEAAVATLLGELERLSPAVLKMTRRQIWRAAGFDFEQGLRATEEFYLGTLMKTCDAEEGVRAFLEKREPAWQGR